MINVRMEQTVESWMRLKLCANILVTYDVSVNEKSRLYPGTLSRAKKMALRCYLSGDQGAGMPYSREHNSDDP